MAILTYFLIRQLFHKIMCFNVLTYYLIGLLLEKLKIPLLRCQSLHWPAYFLRDEDSELCRHGQPKSWLPTCSLFGVSTPEKIEKIIQTWTKSKFRRWKYHRRHTFIVLSDEPLTMRDESNWTQEIPSEEKKPQYKCLKFIPKTNQSSEPTLRMTFESPNVTKTFQPVSAETITSCKCFLPVDQSVGQ